jgi:ABC-type microcin C transport system permease subunit YejE
MNIWIEVKAEIQVGYFQIIINLLVLKFVLQLKQLPFVYSIILVVVILSVAYLEKAWGKQ